MFVFALLTEPHSTLQIVVATKYLLKNVLNDYKMAGKYCLIIVFQSIDNNPIRYKGNKPTQFSEMSGVGRTTNLRLLHH